MRTELVRPPTRPVAPAVLPVALAVMTALAQIGYPLVHGPTRAHLTVVIVLLFAATAVTHAGFTRGPGFALTLLVLTAALGLGAEILGVHIGVPFGRYAYGSGLGPQLGGVPVVIGLAWTMFAWPAAVVALRLARSFPARVVIGGWALASWDLFLDPQQVAAGRWHWRFPDPHLPGVPSVPLTNYAGWLLVSMLVSLLVQALVRGRPAADDRVGYGLLLWTWLSSALALAVFLDLAGAAAWGLAGMGLVAVPLIGTLLSSERRRRWARLAS